MNKKNIFSVYINFFSFLVKILLLFGFCALFALLVVTPLWKFSVSNPSLYSTTVGFGVFVLLVSAGIKTLHSFFKNTPHDEQKSRIYNGIRRMILVLLITAALAVFILFVMKGYRFYGILSLIIGLILYGFAALVYKKK